MNTNPTPRGLRNNNPLNIRRSKMTSWQGQVISLNGHTDSAFCQFRTLAYGYRAAIKLLYNYQRYYRCNSIHTIISRWAPPTENNTEGYISSVEKRSGVGRNKVLTADSGSDYRKIVAAMSHCENGIPAVMADLEAGFRLQTKIKNR